MMLLLMWQAQASGADTVLIMLGTNDAKGFNWNAPRFTRDLESLYRSFATLSVPPRVVALVPPPVWTKASPYGIMAGVVNHDLPSLIREVTARLGVQLIPLDAAFNSSHADITCDLVHPTESGHVLIADAVATWLLQSESTHEG